jgi:hypothetical protein
MDLLQAGRGAAGAQHQAEARVVGQRHLPGEARRQLQVGFDGGRIEQEPARHRQAALAGGPPQPLQPLALRLVGDRRRPRPRRHLRAGQPRELRLAELLAEPGHRPGG